MRTTRALIAGFGTTGTLVAAVACVFVVASAVVAFNGWPGSGIGDPIEAPFVHDPPPRVHAPSAGASSWRNGPPGDVQGAGTNRAGTGSGSGGGTAGLPGVPGLPDTSG